MIIILSRSFGLAKKLIWNSVFWVVAFAIFVFGLYILNYSLGWIPALGNADPDTPDLIEGLTVAGLLVTIFALLVRLWFAKRNDENTQKNLQQFRRSDRSNRFNAAVSQLARQETVLGGFYGIVSAVEDRDPIREDDNKEYSRQALKILCGYVRTISNKSDLQELVRTAIKNVDMLANPMNSPSSKTGYAEKYKNTITDLKSNQNLFIVNEIVKEMFHNSRVLMPKRYSHKLTTDGFLIKYGTRKELLYHLGLEPVNLNDANLPLINLSGYHLEEINLENAVLVGADLRNAYLSLANLVRTNFDRAMFDGARFSTVQSDFKSSGMIKDWVVSKQLNELKDKWIESIESDDTKQIFKNNKDKPILNIAFARSAKGATFDDETLGIMSKNPEVYKHLCDDLYKDLKRRRSD